MWLPIGHGRVLKPSHSFPAYNQAMKTPHHQQPLKDIQRELMFDEIPEENTEQSSKVGGSQFELVA